MEPQEPSKQPQRVIPQRTYQPYSTSHLETPLFALVLQPLCLSSLQPILRAFYHLRAYLAPPMRVPVVPRRLARALPASAAFCTIGDLALLAPTVVFFLRGIHYTFVVPSLKQSGEMAAFCLYLTYVTAAKSNAPFSFFLGIPYERLIGLHAFSALAALVLAGFHGYVAFQYGGDDHGDSKYSRAVALSNPTLEPNIWKFGFDGQRNQSGTVLLASIMVLVFMSTFSFLRRHFFNLWYYAHLFFGTAVIVSLLLHSVFSALFVTAWWALDLVIRYGVLAGTRNRTTATLRIIGTRKRNELQPHEPAVELRIQKPPGFSYNAGQFVRIIVPAISAVEAHPISISSAPHEDVLTLHVRRLGDWSDRLVALAETKTSTTVLMEGPYGAMSVGLDDDSKYKMVLLVSGGIGVTPCQSIGKQLLHDHRTQGRNLKELRFIWAVRDLEMVQDIPPLLLEQEPNDDYSTASPDFQRMLQRSQSFRKGNASTLQLQSGPFSVEVQSSPFSVSSDPKEQAKLRRRPAIVQADIYCTRGSSSDDPANDVEETSPNLAYNQFHGRPDLDVIFKQMKDDAVLLGETNVAVIGCGPPSLMVSLQKACLSHSSSLSSCKKGGIFFDLHKEHFEL